MAEITVGMVKELRERTQAGMGDCKNALVEAGGDLDKAIEIILKKGIVKAASRAGRIAAEGEVRTVISPDSKRGIIAEINCQTDFVARGDEFKNFVTKVCDVAMTAPEGADLGALKYPGTDRTVDNVRQEVVAKTGENVVIRRWAIVESNKPGGYVHAYIHMGGKLAVIVDAETPSAELAKNAEFRTFIDNTAMQIAAMNPLVVNKSEITPAAIEKQKEIFTAQLKEEGKPEASWPKITEGKVAKWLSEVTLLGQDSVIEAGMTVEQLRSQLSQKLGGDIKVHSFVRFGLGDGIEKKSDNLADEVAKMI